MKNFLKKKNIKVVSMNVNAVKMKNKGQLNTKKKLYNAKKNKGYTTFFLQSFTKYLRQTLVFT